MSKPIISADSHVAEPPHCYVDYIEPKFRDRAPRMVYDEKRGDIFEIEGSQTPIPMSLICAAGKAPEDIRLKGVRFGDLHRGSRINSFMSVVRGNQELMSMFVFDGVFMRHPRLRIVSAEADGGWIPHFMYRMDHAYNRHRHWMRGRELDRSPSEYFREHIHFTFQDDFTAFKFKDDMNIERMMWANDFPHSDSTWPWSQDMLKVQLQHLTAAERDLILHDNVASLYKLETRGLAARNVQ